MEKKNQKTLNRLLIGFAALGTLLTVSGCTTTVKVSDNFRIPPRNTYTAVNTPIRRTIVAQPLDVQIQRTTVVTPTVWVMPAAYGYRRGRYCRGYGGGYGGGYGNGYGNGSYGRIDNPTAGTLLPAL